jgi:hypothetical protein
VGARSVGSRFGLSVVDSVTVKRVL